MTRVPSTGFRTAFLFVAAAGFLGTADTARAAVSTGVIPQDEIRLLCKREEFLRSDLNAIRRSDNFGEVLLYLLDTCPKVAALLTDSATGAVPPTRVRDGDIDRDPGRPRTEPDRKPPEKEKKKKKKHDKNCR